MKVINRNSAIDGTSPEGYRNIYGAAENITFHNVSFNYPSRPDIEVLHGVNFELPANKHTAIVGSSGSGKSTIASLLERFYDPTKGNILFGTRDLRDVNVRYLRGSIGFVQQEPTLLDRSILENIAHGLVNSVRSEHEVLRPALLDSTLPDLVEELRQGASEENTLATHGEMAREIVSLVRNAASVANAIDFIETLPHGFATHVGTSGSRLSGGQKQRVALARAVIRQPTILLLDEATAALDSESEQLIRIALRQISQSLTTVSIAHRLATAKEADNIIVVQHGHVVQQGSHHDLIVVDGTYANMVRLQSLGGLSVPSSASSSIRGIPVEKSVQSSQDDISKSGNLTDTSEMLQTKPANKTGAVDKIKVIDEKPAKRSLFSTIKHSFPLIRPHLLHICLGTLTSAVIGGSYSGEAVIFGHTVSSLSPCKGASKIQSSGNFFGLLFFILALIEFFAVLINGSVFGWAAEKILYRIRVLSLRTLLRKSLEWHTTNERTPGTLISHVTSDATAISNLTGTTIGILCSIIVSLISGIVLSHIVAWKIAIVLLATVPVLLASGILRLQILSQFQERHQKAFAQATAITIEAVNNLKLIAAYSLESEVYEVFRQSLRAPYQKTLKAITYGNFWLSMAYSISNLVYALAYWWGSQQILARQYSQTQFFIVLPALLFSTQSCGQMFALAPDISRARVAAGNIVDLLFPKSDHIEDVDDSLGSGDSHNELVLKQEGREKDVEAFPGTKPPPNDKPFLGSGGIGVSIRNVYFAYPSRKDQMVLNGLDIDIPAGKFCALVGPSGSGKSTTFAMIEKFYRPTSGSVIVNGVDITRGSSESSAPTFRHEISLVPQDNVLFEGSVAFNIALGAHPDHEATQEEIEQACRLANVHEVIASLPEGYQTICSQDGRQFSGGQRQRLSIARALLRRPRLLLLDESTSALDVESEKHLQESLSRIARGMSVVAIAHRLNTIYRADRIFLFEGGRCVDQGTHLELIERSESYRRNVIHQSIA